MSKGAPKGRRCTICQDPQRPNIDLDCNGDQPAADCGPVQGLGGRGMAARPRAPDTRDPRRAGDEGAGARGRHAPDFARPAAQLPPDLDFQPCDYRDFVARLRRGGAPQAPVAHSAASPRPSPGYFGPQHAGDMYPMLMKILTICVD